MNDRVASLFFLCDILTPWSDDQTNEELSRNICSGAVNWPLVVSIATEQVVITTLLNSLVNKNLFNLIPDDLKQYLGELHRLNKVRNGKILNQIKNVLEILNTIDVTPVLLKGAAFLYTDKDIASRMMIDIDLLIRQKDGKKVIDSLFSEGYGLGVDEPELYDVAQHFPPLVHPSEPVPVEIHTELLPPMGPQVLKGSSAYNRSKAISDGELTFRLLSPSYSIHYALLHTEIHHRGHSSGAVFLKGFHDFATQTLSYGNDINWSDIQSLMKEYGLEDVLISYLYTAKRLFRVPTPPGLPAARASRIHFQRRLMQVRYKWLMLLADRISEIIYLFSAPAIQARFGCSDGFLSLLGGRMKYIQYLFRTYVFGKKKNRFLDVLMGRQR